MIWHRLTKNGQKFRNYGNIVLEVGKFKVDMQLNSKIIWVMKFGVFRLGEIFP
jgi:hypothetical protein